MSREVRTAGVFHFSRPFPYRPAASPASTASATTTGQAPTTSSSQESLVTMDSFGEERNVPHSGSTSPPLPGPPATHIPEITVLNKRAILPVFHRPSPPQLQTEIDDPVERKITSEINAVSSKLVDEIIESAADLRAKGGEQAVAEEQFVMDTDVGLSGTPPPTFEAPDTNNGSDSGHGSPNDPFTVLSAENAENALNEEIAKLDINDLSQQQLITLEGSDGMGEGQATPPSSTPPKRVGSPLISEESDSIKESLLVPHHVEDVKEPEPESPTHVSHPPPFPAEAAQHEEQPCLVAGGVVSSSTSTTAVVPPPRPPSPLVQILAQQPEESDEKTSTMIVDEGLQQEMNDQPYSNIEQTSVPLSAGDKIAAGEVLAKGVEPDPVTQQSNTSSAGSERQKGVAGRYYDAAKKRCVVA